VASDIFVLIVYVIAKIANLESGYCFFEKYLWKNKKIWHLPDSILKGNSGNVIIHWNTGLSFDPQFSLDFLKHLIWF